VASIVEAQGYIHCTFTPFEYSLMEAFLKTISCEETIEYIKKL
jgi:hypothetical protein